MKPYHKRLPHPLRLTVAAVIKPGDRSPDVRIVQNAVNRITVGQAPSLVLDGSYGPATEAAVRRLQHNAHIYGDGIVGPQTKRLLDLI